MTRSIFCASPRARRVISEASATIPVMRGETSSTRICTREISGVTLVLRSATVCSTRAAVRRSWMNRTMRTTACRTTASAVTTTKNGIQLSIRFPRRDYLLSLGFFALIRVAPSIDGGCNRFLLPHGNRLAPLQNVLGAFAQFPRFALGVFAALIGLLREVFARFIARFRREQNSNQRPDAEANQKET